MLNDLVDENRQQLSLLDPPQTEEKRKRGQKLMDTMDALNLLEKRRRRVRYTLAYLKRTLFGTYAALTEVHSILKLG